MDKEQYDFLKLYKKIHDNSFYPAMYNIEKNCIEYPPIPNIIYWTFPGYHKFYKEFIKKNLDNMKENLNIKIPESAEFIYINLDNEEIKFINGRQVPKDIRDKALRGKGIINDEDNIIYISLI